ncbi:MAG: hypothetical protein J5831_02365 [Bacteroidales bacterium]|nr:hypothetical protein [Bacteroidales bacterium]
MNRKALYITLFGLTVALLALPAVQQYAKLFTFRPLNGVTVEQEQPRLTFKSFMDGSFQSQEDRYLSEHVGFREPLVRCYNQLCWSLFRSTQNKTIYINDDNYIFTDFTVKHHYGQSVYDFGDSSEAVIQKMQASAVMLYQLQTLLKEYGVSFFVCLAPGKDLVCEEHVPKVKGFDRPPGVWAISYFPPVFDSLGINYLDFSDYCLQIKDTVSYPLYLKSSSHWSHQTAAYMADTLFHYMEHLGGFNMHDLRYSEPYLAPTRDPDADLECVMNLLWPIETDQNYYVDVSLDDDTAAIQPRWLCIGDSYYWEWHYGLPLDQLFSTHHFWYYNNTVFSDPLHSNVNEVDLLRELLSSDVVMLLYAPSNLYNLNRRFLTNALCAFYYEDGTLESTVEKIKQDIRNTPEWIADIERQAAEKGQPVDQVLEENARYALMDTPAAYFDEFKEARVPSCRNSRVAKVLSELQDPVREDYRRQIVGNEDWLNLIREKARQGGITLDEAIEKDIDWMLANPN